MKREAPIQVESSAVHFVRRFDPDCWHKLAVNPYNYNNGQKEGSTANVTPHEQVVKLLDRKLSSRRNGLVDIIWLGAEGDPYPPTEKRQRLSRRILEVIAKHGYPLFVATQSPLMLRDIDLIREINEFSQATVAIKIPSISQSILRQIERGTPSPTKRIEMIERVRRSGIQFGLMLSPLILGVNDNPRDLEKIFRLANDYNCDFIIVDHGEDSEKAAVRQHHRQILELSRLYNVSLRMKRFIPTDYRRENYWVAKRLADQAYYRKIAGYPFRQYLTMAKKINDLRTDLRNMMSDQTLRTASWMDADVWPTLEEMLNGQWCSDNPLKN